MRNGHSDAAAILAEIERAAPRSQDLTLNSSHPQGGNPMSDRPDIGVVDSGFRVHGTRNVYVLRRERVPHVDPHQPAGDDHGVRGLRLGEVFAR